MTTIASRDRPTIRDLLARELVDDVELVLFLRERSQPAATGRGDGLTSDETRELLEDLVGLSDQLHLMTYDVGDDPAATSRYNVSAVPTVLIRRNPRDTQSGTREVTGIGGTPGTGHAAPELNANVRFLGLPA